MQRPVLSRETDIIQDLQQLVLTVPDGSPSRSWFRLPSGPPAGLSSPQNLPIKYFSTSSLFYKIFQEKCHGNHVHISCCVNTKYELALLYYYLFEGVSLIGV